MLQTQKLDVVVSAMLLIVYRCYWFVAGWILAAIFNIFTTLVNKEHVKRTIKINQRTLTLRTNYKNQQLQRDCGQLQGEFWEP